MLVQFSFAISECGIRPLAPLYITFASLVTNTILVNYACPYYLIVHLGYLSFSLRFSLYITRTD